MTSMTYECDSTHDPEQQSWVASANLAATDFPLQNLPFGRFRKARSEDSWRIGVAIGDQVLDLRAAGLVNTADMNAVMAVSRQVRKALRLKIFNGLSERNGAQPGWEKALVPQSLCEYTTPCNIGNYTDFYVGIHHATTVGKLFRPDNPLLPNYKWVPIGYHGRASSIVPHSTPVRRPLGQLNEEGGPVLSPTRRLDFELELGFLVGSGNSLGSPISIEHAEDHLFGVTLFNDWSARDIQAWEYQPLGPFLSKNFGSTISPWIVTMEALSPFRSPFSHPDNDPKPLPYLDSVRNRNSGGIDIELEVQLQTAVMRSRDLRPVSISRSNSALASYWTPAQLIAHHSVNGCNLQAGDLLGSGTLSGPHPNQAGSLLELTRGGRDPILLPNGEKRTFLEDGDALSLVGWCERPGFRRIGFGPCSGTIIAPVDV